MKSSLRRRAVRSLLPAFLLAAPVLLTQGLAFGFDADSDAVPDDADAFPCNGNSASVVFAPAQGQHGLMLFEDQWPEASDLDFNDAVVAYNYIFELTASGQVRSIRATFNAQAVGGVFNNGLGLQLPVPTSAVASVVRTIGAGNTTVLTPVAQDPKLTLHIVDNLRELFGGVADPINSDPSQPTLSGQPIEVEVRFSTPQSIDLGLAPFDLFIYRTEAQSHEVHRPQYAGTALMDAGLFGSGIDTSTASRHFVDSTGLPFALNLPAPAPWSREGVAIHRLYPNIVGFAASGGTQNQDFYRTGVDLDYAYGWSAPESNGPDPSPDLSISNWHSPVALSFVGPDDIPADTGCVNAWGLSVQYGTARDTFGYDSTVDGNGDLIVTGYTRRSFVGFSNQGLEDIFVAKYNRQTGALLWSRQVGGAGSEAGRSVAVDSAGNIYIVGETRSALPTQTNAGQFDAFLLKLDASGNLLWTRQLGGSGYDYGTGVAVSGSAVYVTGGSNSTNLPGATSPGAGISTFLARYDTSGNRQWTTQYKTDGGDSANYSYGAKVAVDSSGAVIVVGSERRYNQSASSAENQVVVKHNGSSGAAIWTQHLGDYGYYNGTADYRFGHGLGVVTDSAGAIYVSGSWEAGTRVSSWGSWTRTAGDTSSEMTLTKLDASGASLWSRSLGATNARSDVPLALQYASDGSLYFTGYTYGALSGNTSTGGFDYVAGKLNASTGATVWLTQSGTASDDGAFGTWVDTSRGVLIVAGNSGNVAGNPSAYQNTFFGFIAQHSLSTGARTAFNATVDTTLVQNSCKGTQVSGSGQGDGIYTVDPDGSGPGLPFDVRCDMTTDGGGWIVFQRRVDGSVNFYRGWADYKAGFGNLATNFWIGNDKLNALTTAMNAELRVDMRRGTDSRYAKYTKFAIGTEATKYVLTATGYSGNAGGDSLAEHNGRAFTTLDQDNDIWSGNCAVTFQGAWWYTNCHASNLNGVYGATGYANGIDWYYWLGHYTFLDFDEMKLREH